MKILLGNKVLILCQVLTHAKEKCFIYIKNLEYRLKVHEKNYQISFGGLASG